jgi:ATP-dependent DNA helicase RecG
VKQRRELVSLEEDRANAHLLQMTATPIPRTIALSFFGNYQISVLEKLETRKEVTSFLVPESKRSGAYQWIAERLKSGGQAFWVMPLIEIGDDSAQKSIKKDSELIAKAFKGIKTATIHGKIKASEKSELLAAFQAKKYAILIATTVIEVGIDIPAANIIVIENAENYGLAQLHQLRGRVGRANQEAWCLLFYDENSSQAKERLSFFAREHNGIKIAEYDLSRRGPGEVYGTEQSGIPNLKVARFSDLKLLKETRIAAEEVLSSKSRS